MSRNSGSRNTPFKAGKPARPGATRAGRQQDSAPAAGTVQKGVQLVGVDEDMAGQRVDNFLMARLRKMPKSIVYRIVRKGEVRVNKGRVKPDTRLQSGDVVRIPPVVQQAKAEQPKPGDRVQGVMEAAVRSEERRVGKECRWRWSAYHEKKR